MSVVAFHTFPIGRRRRTALIQPDARRTLRVRVWLTRWQLDSDIAAGCPPQWSTAHALRVRQLTDRRTRASVARSLRGIVDYVDRVSAVSARKRTYPSRSAVMIEPLAVIHCREAILGLAERIDGPASVSARGVAMASAVITNAISSPLFDSHCERTLADVVWEVADALSDTGAASPM